MLNLTLRLQKLHTLLSFKLWYQLVIGIIYFRKLSTKNQVKAKIKSISTLESHEVIHCIAYLKRPLYIFNFSLSNTYIFDSKNRITN